jgi:rhodanese-related sulfurtransferase
MPIRRVTPAEAVELVAQGWIYVDVRTIPEFDAGHPRGAYNLPLMQQGAAGRVANPDFVAIAESALGKGARVVLGCAGGTRARRAADLLAEAGFEELAEMPTGFSGGEKDATGRIVTPGWKGAGLPIDLQAEPGHRYDDLAAKVREGKP